MSKNQNELRHNQLLEMRKQLKQNKKNLRKTENLDLFMYFEQKNSFKKILNTLELENKNIEPKEK